MTTVSCVWLKNQTTFVRLVNQSYFINVYGFLTRTKKWKVISDEKLLGQRFIDLMDIGDQLPIYPKIITE
jgi:hypothetical protein